uniref:Uncharacterized protein n=1 Tax=viral metagenome TaxID=1070528 RepID=A0A6C0AE04_9ZZZZ
MISQNTENIKIEFRIIKDIKFCSIKTDLSGEDIFYLKILSFKWKIISGISLSYRTFYLNFDI